MLEDEIARTRFHALDLSRGIAALGILIFHLAGRAWPLNALYIFVDFFFVLSGFVLYNQIPKSIKFSNQIVFARKRFVRLVPTAWLVILATYLAYFSIQKLNLIDSEDRVAVSYISLLLALFFLQSVLPFCGVLVTPMWSLSTEIVVNFIFSIVGLKRNYIFLLALISGASLGVAGLYGNNTNSTSGWIALMRGIYGFSCGLIAREMANLKVGVSKSIMTVVFSTNIAVFYVVSLSAQYLILVAPIMAGSVYVLSKIKLTNSRMISLSAKSGEYSFGLYLWHFPVIYFVNTLIYDNIHLPNLMVIKFLEIVTIFILAILLTWLTLKITKRTSNNSS